ncbi:MAG: hypothetical protein J6T10_22280 [Methanobrevibacter sp.]|nr:hypothetical protein [Methanobrevibacter sp.]
MNNSWKEATILNDVSLQTALLIIDDATAHGFTFLVQDHKIYYTEDDTNTVSFTNC